MDRPTELDELIADGDRLNGRSVCVPLAERHRSTEVARTPGRRQSSVRICCTRVRCRCIPIPNLSSHMPTKIVDRRGVIAPGTLSGASGSRPPPARTNAPTMTPSPSVTTREYRPTSSVRSSMSVARVLMVDPGRSLPRREPTGGNGRRYSHRATSTRGNAPRRRAHHLPDGVGTRLQDVGADRDGLGAVLETRLFVVVSAMRLNVDTPSTRSRPGYWLSLHRPDRGTVATRRSTRRCI